MLCKYLWGAEVLVNISSENSVKQVGIILYHQDNSRQERKLLVEIALNKESEDVGLVSACQMHFVEHVT